MLRVAKLYYKDNLDLKAIADKFDFSVSKVSRLLKESRRAGLVRITIDEYSSHFNSIEEELEKKSGIDEVLISPAELNNEENIIKNISSIAAEYFNRIIPGHKTFAFSWGKTLSEMSKKIICNRTPDILLIPAMGGIGQIKADYNPNFIVKLISEKLNCNYLQLNSPIIVEQKGLKEKLLSEKSINEIIEKIRLSEVIFTCIGPLENNIRLLQSNIISREGFQELIKSKAVGEICGRFFNSGGDIANAELDNKTIGIEFNDFLKIKRKVAV
ncbi:MAG: hypothetical protein JW770_03495, partial [Actinobacteria bacterium]|nr:hypothetical protein [Actinomycetota bacterium]